MSIERRMHHRTPRPTADDLLTTALEQSRLAYQFAPGSCTLGAMTAVIRKKAASVYGANVLSPSRCPGSKGLGDTAECGIGMRWPPVGHLGRLFSPGFGATRWSHSARTGAARLQHGRQ
jgi:hypothetical protein